MIKDFDSFMNHDKLFDEDSDKLFGRSLVQLFDDKWKEMRTNLSPIFTSSKMKMMFGMLSECAQDFVNHFEKKIGNGKIIVDAADMFARFTVNGISTTALGFKGDCLENEKSSLFKLADGLFKMNLKRNLKMYLSVIAKPIYVLLGFQFLSKGEYDFFERAIIDVMDDREKKNISRPDVIQLLIQAKNGQLVRHENDDDKNLKNFAANIEYDVGANNKKVTKWTKEDFMAQGLIFFVGGFDTTKTLLQMTSYELAKNQGVQQELLDEVDEMLSALDGKPITYEALHQMKFLDQVISESLRYWPPALFTNRECNKDYKLNLGNGKTVSIKKGEIVLIPIASMHRDPAYFDNPNVFDPHRFDDDRKDSILPGSYIPFGYGPRVCIGSRFALMEAKLLIFNLLSKFSIEKCDKTPKNIKFNSQFGQFTFKDKIFVEFKPRFL